MDDNTSPPHRKDAVAGTAERPFNLYLELNNGSQYHDYLHIATAEEDYEEADNYYGGPEDKVFDATPDSGIHDLSIIDVEQIAKYEEDWKAELAKTEEEITTLRQVLSAKIRHAQDLKRNLGITPWKELKDDMEQSLKNIQEAPGIREVGGKLVEWNSAITSAPIYQKTSATLKTAGEKTTSVLGTIGASMTKKFGEVKNSSAYRSFEERVGSAYTNVKTRMNNSRSTSLYSFEEALSSSNRPSGFSSAAATPTIPDKLGIDDYASST